MVYYEAMNKLKKMINKIKSGDQEAFNNLLELHYKMIFSIINSFNKNNGDFSINEDDLFQEGSLGLYEAVLCFDDSIDIKFSTFAYNIIRRKILNEIRRQKRIYEKESYSIDSYSFFEQRAPYLINEDMHFYKKQDSINYLLENVISKLSIEDRTIVKMRREQIPYKQISETLNISSKRVDNRISSIKRKCKKALKELEE